MQAELPVLACTDSNTDVGKVIVNGGFGWWCESDDEKTFSEMIAKINEENLSEHRAQSRKYLLDVYSVQKVYPICIDSLLDRISNEKFE
jgi:hypothetical protein